MSKMARTLNLIVSLLLFLLTAKVSFADPSSPIPPSVACRSTPDPQFCKSVLPTMRNTSNSLYYYSRFSLLKSLSNAKKWYTKLQDYLNDHTNNARLSPAATSAIKDCLMLSGLNIEYLNSAIKTLNGTDSNTLLDPNVDTLQTLLSALLTNHQTCADGLVGNDIAIPSISNCSKLYTVSLALYTNAWNPNGTRHHFHNGFTTRKVLKNPNVKSIRPGGRRLLQEVLVYNVVVVSKNGGSKYNTIGAAVAAAPKYLDGTKGYFLIYVMPGVYNEYISIAGSQSYLMIVGGGIGRTVITGNRNAGPIWSTFSSATFAVGGRGFVGTGLTIQNTAGAINGQAVALRNTADFSSFYDCSIEGYQDTLYAHSMRQFYRDCDIYGTVDFIFGNAAAVFQNCNIYARVPLPGQGKTITAQSRSDPNQNTGFSLQGCQFKAAPDLAATKNVVPTFLGRPWRPYSRVVVMQSFLDSLISPAGWSIWPGTYGLTTLPLYYAEFDNWGPGSWSDKRVTWPGCHLIGSNEASNFTVSAFITGDNWLGKTGVPYNSGFLK